MRKLLFLSILIFVASLVNAQHDTHYSMFMFNKLAYNPGYAGSKEHLCLTGHYRNQWEGITGAPKTYTFGIHSPFFKNRAGLGLSLVSDRIGIMNNLYATLSYAYRIKIKEKSTLAIGLSGTIEQGRLDWALADPLDQGDNLLPNVRTSKLNPNFGLGVYYNNEKFYAGVSVPKIFETTVYDDDPISGGQVSDWRAVYFMGGAIMRLSKNVQFHPAVLVKYNPHSPFDMDLNASFVFMEKVWIGGSYRLQDSFDAVLRFQVTQRLKLGVAADLTLSELRNYSPGSFELMLQYCFLHKAVKLNNIRFF